MEFNHKLLEQVKNKFFKILKENYISKHFKSDEMAALTDNTAISIDSLFNRQSEIISRREKIIRNILSLIDIHLEQSELSISLTGDPGIYYKIISNKIIIGAIKGINKHKEMHFILIAQELKIKEYLTDNGELNEFMLFTNNKVFLNAKFEYGLFPKNLSLINTLNIKLDICGTYIEISTRAIESLFEQIVSHVLIFRLK